MVTTSIFEDEHLDDIRNTLYMYITGHDLIYLKWIHVNRAKYEIAR